MKKLPENIYKLAIEKITNNQVPYLFSSVLEKTHKEIDSIENGLSSQALTRLKLFGMFEKQYNTILRISEKLTYVNKDNEVYLDIKSINVLIRAAHELFLTFGYLVESGHISGVTPEQEIEFKYLCYEHGGRVDIIKSYENKKTVLPYNFYEDQINFAKKNRADILEKIKKHVAFSKLTNDVKKSIEDFGAWRISKSKSLSWNELSHLTKMGKSWAKSEYHHMSIHAHSGFAAILLEKDHNQDTHGLLTHLYIIAALFVSIVVEKMSIDVEKSFSIDERAILEEMINLSNIME